MSEAPLVSIVIPSYNEERDILACLEAVQRIDYPQKETIVVDCSSDHTPALLRPLADTGGIRLIHKNERISVSAARNMGVRVAEGEIVVLLNADVMPPADFIHRILPHYRDGADFVICESEVANQGKAVPDFIHAVHVSELGKEDDLVWSEGWSCRRKLFEKAGYFDEGFPAAAGEDEAFGRSLLRLGLRRVVDHNIRIPHITPEDAVGFVHQMVGRGRGEFYYAIRMEHRDPRAAVRQIYRRWGTLLGGAILLGWYPVGTAIGLGGLILMALRALRSGAMLARSHGGPRRIPAFAILNFVRFRCKEFGFVRAWWRWRRLPDGAGRRQAREA